MVDTLWGSCLPPPLIGSLKMTLAQLAKRHCGSFNQALYMHSTMGSALHLASAMQSLVRCYTLKVLPFSPCGAVHWWRQSHEQCIMVLLVALASTSPLYCRAALDGSLGVHYLCSTTVNSHIPITNQVASHITSFTSNVFCNIEPAWTTSRNSMVKITSCTCGEKKSNIQWRAFQTNLIKQKLRSSRTTNFSLISMLEIPDQSTQQKW